MKFIKLLILLSGLTLILNNCSTFSEAGKVLRNENAKTTDEFLIKKNEPLAQPPDFKKIPEPGTVESRASTSQNTLKKILNENKSEDNNEIKSSSTEESILRKIKK